MSVNTFFKNVILANQGVPITQVELLTTSLWRLLCQSLLDSLRIWYSSLLHVNALHVMMTYICVSIWSLTHKWYGVKKAWVPRRIIFSGICLHPFVTPAVCHICQLHVASNVIPLISWGRASCKPSFLVQYRSDEKLALVNFKMQDATFQCYIVITSRYGWQAVVHRAMSGSTSLSIWCWQTWQPAPVAYLHARSAHTES